MVNLPLGQALQRSTVLPVLATGGCWQWAPGAASSGPRFLDCPCREGTTGPGVPSWCSAFSYRYASTSPVSGPSAPELCQSPGPWPPVGLAAAGWQWPCPCECPRHLQPRRGEGLCLWVTLIGGWGQCPGLPPQRSSWAVLQDWVQPPHTVTCSVTLGSWLCLPRPTLLAPHSFLTPRTPQIFHLHPQPLDPASRDGDQDQKSGHKRVVEIRGDEPRGQSARDVAPSAAALRSWRMPLQWGRGSRSGEGGSAGSGGCRPGGWGSRKEPAPGWLVRGVSGLLCLV